MLIISISKNYMNCFVQGMFYAKEVILFTVSKKSKHKHLMYFGIMLCISIFFILLALWKADPYLTFISIPSISHNASSMWAADTDTKILTLRTWDVFSNNHAWLHLTFLYFLISTHFPSWEKKPYNLLYHTLTSTLFAHMYT